MQRLTEEQMGKLGEKYGYFEFKDAQGDASRSYADEAIGRYLHMAEGAARMLDALNKVLFEYDESEGHVISEATIKEVCAAINAAEKYPPVKREG